MLRPAQGGTNGELASDHRDTVTRYDGFVQIGVDEDFHESELEFGIADCDPDETQLSAQSRKHLLHNRCRSQDRRNNGYLVRQR